MSLIDDPIQDAVLTDNEREEVFAQYLNKCELYQRGGHNIPNNVENLKYSKTGSSTLLILKSLEDVEDKDMIEIAKLAPRFMWTKNSTFKVYKNTYGNPVVSVGEGIFANDKYVIDFQHGFKKLHYSQVQYLKNQAYAVPLHFSRNHWANGKNAVQLGLAIVLKNETNAE